jgi:predicted ATPase
LQLCDVHVVGYRSLRAIRFPVDRLSVFVGANGVGKTNLYRALQLVQAAGCGTLSRELAAEGGMEAALWAGERQDRKPVRMSLAVGLAAAPSHQGGQRDPREGSGSVVHSYEVELGVRYPIAAAFALEPQVKEETLTFHHRGRTQKLLERRGPAVFARDGEGRRQELGAELMPSETALAALEDPARFPDIHAIRRTMQDWRFYHDMRTEHSPMPLPRTAASGFAR